MATISTTIPQAEIEKRTQAEKTKNALSKARVPKYTIKQTLPKLNRGDLRSIVEENFAVGSKGVPCVEVYSSYSGRDQTIFDVLCKEIALCVSAYYVNVRELHDMLEQESYEFRAELPKHYGMLMVPDYSIADDSRLTTREWDLIDNAVLSFVKNNRGVCLCMNKEVNKTGLNRDDRLLKLISNYSVVITL